MMRKYQLLNCYIAKLLGNGGGAVFSTIQQFSNSAIKNDWHQRSVETLSLSSHRDTTSIHHAKRLSRGKERTKINGRSKP